MAIFWPFGPLRPLQMRYNNFLLYKNFFVYYWEVIWKKKIFEKIKKKKFFSLQVPSLPNRTLNLQMTIMTTNSVKNGPNELWFRHVIFFLEGFSEYIIKDRGKKFCSTFGCRAAYNKKCNFHNFYCTLTAFTNNRILRIFIKKLRFFIKSNMLHFKL
jgi:hypothetical protein